MVGGSVSFKYWPINYAKQQSQRTVITEKKVKTEKKVRPQHF